MRFLRRRQTSCSPPSTFTLPDYAACIADAYAKASPCMYQRKRRYNPRVRKFIDDEAEQGEEFNMEVSADSETSSSDGL